MLHSEGKKHYIIQYGTADTLLAMPSPFSSEEAKLCNILHITAFTAAHSLLLSPSEKLTVPQLFQKFPACYET
jgi:hypothetical protein